MSPVNSISAKAILIAEDKHLIAYDLECQILEEGYSVVGPGHAVSVCLDLLESESVDGAILDVDLTDGKVFPVADALTARDIPFVFHTGSKDVAGLQTRYTQAKIFSKPSTVFEMLRYLRDNI